MRERKRKGERKRESENACEKKKEDSGGGGHVGTHRHEEKGALSLSHRVWIERRVSIGYFIITKG